MYDILKPRPWWFLAFLSGMALVILYMCTGCETAPKTASGQQANTTATEVAAVGKKATASAQVLGKAADGVAKKTKDAGVNVTGELDDVRGVAVWLTETAPLLSGAAITLNTTGSEVDRLAAELATEKQKRLDAEKREREAAESVMLIRAGWFGFGIVGCLIVAAFGVWIAVKTGNVWVCAAGLAGAVGCFLGVLVFAALAWVMAHFWWVLAGTVLVIGGVAALLWWFWKNGYFRFRSLDSGMKLAVEAFAETDPAKAVAKFKEAFASLRTDADVSASWDAAKTK